MIGLLRLAVFGFIALTVLYVLISIYSRSVRREKLENEWEAKGSVGAREDFVRDGMAEYESSLRKKLILLVYVVPIVVALVMLYVTNFS